MSNQSLSAKNAKSSANFYAWISHTRANANHTWCGGAARGYSGYTSTPTTGGNTTKVSASCSGAGERTYPATEWNITRSEDWRGAVYNPNISTSDLFYSASTSWGCVDWGC